MKEHRFICTQCGYGDTPCKLIVTSIDESLNPIELHCPFYELDRTAVFEIDEEAEDE